MIIVEGIDGSGKTTIADYLSKKGYFIYHFSFDEKNSDIEEKYLNLLNCETRNMVLDRCFISELVYGPVLRNHCKLDKKQLENILKKYSEINPVILYLKANKDDILSRRKNDNEDYDMLSDNFDSLNNRYEKVFNVISKYLNVIEINTSEMSIEEMHSLLEGKFNGNNLCREHIER